MCYMSLRIKNALFFTFITIVAVIAGLCFMRNDRMYPRHRRNAVSLTRPAAYFTHALQSKVVQELGRPIEGFEQGMFMQVYPGLMPTDFAWVETVGSARGPSPVVTSADNAITAYGMGTLLENIARRVGMPIRSEYDVDRIVSILETEPETPVAIPPAIGSTRTRTNLTGTAVCLPHVNQVGPQTMECAIGMKTDDGSYYAVDASLSSQLVPELVPGMRFSASGLFTPVEMLSSDHWRAYPIKGIFSITDSFKKQ